MIHYGQSITWGTDRAPTLFTGICTGYSYHDQVQRQLDEDTLGEYRALIQHGRKAAISFDARVTASSSDFFDLSAGASIAVAGLDGLILASRAVEKWAIGQSKTVSVTAMHYPNMILGGGHAAGALDVFTPASQGFTFMQPGGSLIWGTKGITQASGIVHSLEVAQELQITEDDEDPTGAILGATSHGYLRTIKVEILAGITSGSPSPIPVIGQTLTFGSDGPPHTTGYQVETAEKKFAEKRGLMYSVTAVWFTGI